MALNKRKVLDSARKLAQKGAKAKALKEYQLLLQADPRDAKLLLEVGDCYRRWGQIEDAIASDEIFDRLMGEEVEPRRVFIETNALGVRNLDV